MIINRISFLVRILLDLSYYSIILFFNLISRNDFNSNLNLKLEKIKCKCNEILMNEKFLLLSSNSKISIIIPSYNEENHIHNTLNHILQGQDNENIEIIISDGGSKDRTINIIKDYCLKYDNIKLITGGNSRSSCQNLGAQSSTGEILLFLHADTILPLNYGKYIRSALTNVDCILGSFSFDIDDHNVLGMNFIVELVRLRCLYFHLPYGDQTIFIRKDIFEALGGFMNIPLMEDYELVKLVHKLFSSSLLSSWGVYVLNEKVQTSTRRWKDKGVIYTTIMNQIVLFGRAVGVPHSVLVKWYYR